MENWLAGAALVVAVVAVPIAIWATRQWGTRRARLDVSISAIPLLPDDSLGLLKVTYREIDVENPHLVSVSLRNTGPRDVSTETFDAGKPIAVRFDQTFYGLTSRADGGMRLTAPAIGTSGSRAVVDIAPGLLKRGETWSFSAVTTGPVEVTIDAPLVDTDIQEAISPEDQPEVTLRVAVLGIPVELPLPRGLAKYW